MLEVRDVNGKVLDKPGQQVLIGSEFIIDSEPMFVSRGGEKLFEAFKRLEIKVKDKILNYLIPSNFKLELKNYPLLSKEINAKIFIFNLLYYPEKCYIRK